MTKRKILVVDDAPSNIRILVEILAKDFETSVATSGEEALNLVFGRNQPELVLLDIFMPEMDGFTVCSRIRENEKQKDLPVIFITADTDDATVQKAFAAGGSDYVRKPVNRVELLTRIHSQLDHVDLVQKRMEEERLKGVLELAGAVCHELNQPLQNISGFLELLMDRVKKNNPDYEYLEIIRKQTEKMGQITRKLMQITTYETMEYVKDTRIIDIYKASEKDCDDK